jgi:hypothetical protein
MLHVDNIFSDIFGLLTGLRMPLTKYQLSPHHVPEEQRPSLTIIKMITITSDLYEDKKLHLCLFKCYTMNAFGGLSLTPIAQASQLLWMGDSIHVGYYTVLLKK